MHARLLRFHLNAFAATAATAAVEYGLMVVLIAIVIIVACHHRCGCYAWYPPQHLLSDGCVQRLTRKMCRPGQRGSRLTTEVSHRPFG